MHSFFLILCIFTNKNFMCEYREMRYLLFAGIICLFMTACISSNIDKEREKRMKDSTIAVDKLKKESDSLDKVFKERRLKDSLTQVEKNKNANTGSYQNNSNNMVQEKKPIQVDQSGGLHFEQSGN